MATTVNGAVHPFLQQIQARQAAVSPIQRRILDFLLDNQEEAVFLTTTALAARLDVS
jgi:DNA-binding MurR/RpiR family transcriptional regulator